MESITPDDLSTKVYIIKINLCSPEIMFEVYRKKYRHVLSNLELFLDL